MRNQTEYDLWQLEYTLDQIEVSELDDVQLKSLGWLLEDKRNQVIEETRNRRVPVGRDNGSGN